MKFLLTLSVLTLLGFSTLANEGGCTFTVDITPSGPTTFCSGDSVTLTATAGATYEWSTGATTQSIVVDFPGNYTVTVTDGLGCEDSDNQLIIVIPSEAIIIPTEQPPYCAGDQVQLFANYIPFADYEWSTGATTVSITVAQSGIYSVTVTNPSGCVSSDSLPIIFIPEVPVFLFEDGPTTFCEGESVNISSSVFIGGSHEWFPTGETTRTITATESGDYYVNVTWPTGCVSTSEVVQVNVVPVPMADAGTDTAFCEGETIDITGAGGSYLLWSTGETDTTITVGGGTYVLTATNPGCDIVSRDTINVVNPTPPQPIIAYDSHALGKPVNFTASNPDSVSTWYWYFGDGDESEEQNPSHTYQTEEEYTVTLVAVDPYGCEGFSQTDIDINQVLNIPTVFTPDGDGTNDLFLVENNTEGQIGIEIYDRWGNVVYNKLAREIRWDGRTATGAQLEAGTYYYVLKLDVFAKHEATTQTGFLTLIR